MARTRTRIVEVEREARKRALRVEIARGRMLTERDVAATIGVSRRLVSWRTYVRQFPGLAMMAASGLGVALSAGFSRQSVKRRLGRRMVTSALSMAGVRLWPEILAFWAETRSSRGDSAPSP